LNWQWASATDCGIQRAAAGREKGTIMVDAIDILRDKKPDFHGTDDDPKNWKSQWTVLEFLAESLRPGMASLETGCGYSSVVFAATGAHHTTVTPSPDEPGRVRKFCEENGIGHEGIDFVIGRSHGFPHPCVDWMYTETRLRVGGLMLIDDIRIPTCRILHDFLKEESTWKLIRFIGDTSIFEKDKPSPDAEIWIYQDYNRNYPDFSFLSRWQRGSHWAVEKLKSGVRAVGMEEPAKRLLGRK
jgi:hypothetical protein